MAPLTYEQTDIPPHMRTATLPVGIPDLTLGWGAIAWAVKYLKQPDGPEAGSRWHFTDSQAKFILWWYAIDDNARFIFNHAVRRLPKGSGKSPFAAVLALIELLAPVRFAHWDEDQPGGVTGKRVSMPLVQIGATAESQASINTMRMVSALVPPRSRIIRDYSLDPGKTQVLAPGGARLSLITNSAQAAEGALTTFAILDQTEAFTAGNGGKELARVVARNLAKSKSRGLETSNAWKPGQESTAEITAKAWFAQQEGRTKGRAKTLMDIRMAPPDVDWDDPKSIEKAVAYAYGDCYWADPEDIVQNFILDPRNALDESKRFYLNWPTVDQNAWTDPADWAAMIYDKSKFTLRDGEDITLGFDGSRTRDASALVGCHVETGFTFVLGVWEIEHDANGKPIPIPIHEVDAAVAMAFRRWNVMAFFSDVREWEGFVKVTWPDEYAEQLDRDLNPGVVWAVSGGADPGPIAWDMRTRVGAFTSACEMVHQEIEDHAFTHDGNTVAARHVTNARNAPNKFGTSISKETPDSPDKIDFTVAMIIARHARRLVLANEKYGSGKMKASKKRAGQVWSWS